MVTSIILALTFAVNVVLCFPDGAPSETCVDMIPGHTDSGFPIESLSENNSPYTLRAKWDSQQKYIRLSVTGDDTLRGFLIQGKRSRKDVAVGKFAQHSNSSIFKYQNCSAEKYGPNSSVTHTNKDEKKDLEFYWEPPVKGTGNVTFYATLVKSFKMFWVMLESNSVSLEPRSKDEKLKPNLPTVASSPTNKTPVSIKTKSAGFNSKRTASATSRQPAPATTAAIKTNSTGFNSKVAATSRQSVPPTTVAIKTNSTGFNSKVAATSRQSAPPTTVAIKTNSTGFKSSTAATSTQPAPTGTSPSKNTLVSTSNLLLVSAVLMFGVSHVF